MTEYMYELKQPFQYAGKNGEMVDASFVTMIAPNYKQIERVTPIKQAFAAAFKEKFSGVSNQAIEEAQEVIKESKEQDTADDESGESEGFEASAIMAIMYGWSGKLTAVFTHADGLFRSGVAMLDGDTPVTKAILEKMSITDFEGMVGTYLANFIIPSLTDGQ